MPGSDIVNANLKLWELTSVRAAQATMLRGMKKAATIAKRERRWKDHPDMHNPTARQGLTGWVEAEGTKIIGSVGHTVPHGVFLELRRDFMGKYRILEQALAEEIPELMTSLQAIFTQAGVGSVVWQVSRSFRDTRVPNIVKDAGLGESWRFMS